MPTARLPDFAPAAPYGVETGTRDGEGGSLMTAVLPDFTPAVPCGVDKGTGEREGDEGEGEEEGEQEGKGEGEGGGGEAAKRARDSLSCVLPTTSGKSQAVVVNAWATGPQPDVNNNKGYRLSIQSVRQKEDTMRDCWERVSALSDALGVLAEGSPAMPQTVRWTVHDPIIPGGKSFTYVYLLLFTLLLSTSVPLGLLAGCWPPRDSLLQPWLVQVPGISIGTWATGFEQDLARWSLCVWAVWYLCVAGTNLAVRVITGFDENLQLAYLLVWTATNGLTMPFPIVALQLHGWDLRR
eukprot:TRINITY_DN42652_c0_g1_i1.p1 TRINITY_DN42652_c0_g1~~TRINITY_DN42652_c0_g1_i1.p1  ORF type:complete len:296 (-),score=32.02 TRINITY_DN42652_c0_g1_i1:7-894(-)